MLRGVGHLKKGADLTGELSIALDFPFEGSSVVKDLGVLVGHAVLVNPSWDQSPPQ